MRQDLAVHEHAVAIEDHGWTRWARNRRFAPAAPDTKDCEFYRANIRRRSPKNLQSGSDEHEAGQIALW